MKSKILSILLVSIFYCGILSAANNVWTGAHSTNWNDALNWSLGNVPSSTDNVTITKTGSNNLSIEISVTVASFTISSSNAVSLQSGYSLTVNGTFNDGGTFTGSSTSTVYLGGTASISGGGTTIFYNLGVNSSATVTTAVSFSIAGTFTNSGSFTASTGTVTFTSTAAQSIAAGTFSSLKILTTNSANVSMTGNVTVNGTLNTALSTGSLVIGANTLILNGTSGLGYTTGSPHIDATSASATVQVSNSLNLSVGGFVSSIINNLTITNNSTVTGNGYTINGVLNIVSGSILSLTSGITAGTSFSTNGTGKLQTQNNSYTALPTPYSYTFTVEYNSTTQAQVLPTGCTFTNLILSNTFAAVTVYGGVSSTVNVSGVLTINPSVTLNMGTSTLLGSFTTSGTGTLQTQSTSATPIPSGRTFTFDVLYNSASAQTIMGGNYNNLNLTGGNRTLSSSTGTIAIAATYTQTSGTLTTSGSTLSLSSSTTLIATTYGSLIVAGGTLTAPSSLTLTGNLTINSGATFTAPSGMLSIAGSFTNSGTFTHNSGNVTFNGGSNQTIPAVSYYSITISNSANTALGGNITINGGLALTTGNLVVGANTLTLAGTFPTRGSGYIDATNASANITIANAMTMSTSVFTGNIYNLTISSGTTTAPSSLTLTGGLTINSGASFTSCSGALSIGGNFSNAGTFTHNNGNVTFNGASNQSMGSATFYNLFINTTNSATVSMTGNVTVLTQLYPQGTTGNLIVGANTLTMGTTFSYVGAHVDATNANATMVIPNSISLSTGGFVSGTFNNLTINNNATLTGTAGYTINGVLTIANGSNLNMGTNAVVAGASFSTSGTGTLQTQSVSATPIPSGKSYTFDVLYNSSNAQTVLGGNYNNLNLSGGNRTLSSSTGTIAVAGTYTQGAGTLTTTGSTLSLGTSTTLLSATYANLIVAGGTITAPSTLTLTGSLTINSGATFAAPSGTLNVAGSFSNSGTFTHNNGTVNLNGTSQVLSGSTSFYSFTKAVSSAATLTFPSGLTQTFAGTLTLTGVSGNLLSIVSSTPATQAIITPTANNWSISYVQVSGNNNNCGTNIIASNVTNKGNNTGWTLSPASYIWTGANSTNWNDAANWNLSSIPFSSDNVTITKTGSNNLSIETSPSVASFSISGSNTVTLLGGNTLTVAGTFNNSGTFTGASTSTVAFSGTSAISGGASSFYHLTVNSGATLTTAVNFSIAGNFTNSGTFTASASAITFNGSSAQSIASGTFYNLIILTTNNANASMTGNVTVNNTLSTAVTGVSSSGSLIVGSNTLTLGTGLAYTAARVDATNTGATIVIPNSISLSMGGFVSGAVNNLTINNNATLTSTANYTINGVLNIANGSTLNMGTSSITGGSSFSTSGTGLLKTQNTSSSAIPSSHTYTFTVEYNSTAAAQVLPTGCSFNNLTIGNTYGAVTVFGGLSSTLDVSGVLAVNSVAVLNMGTSTLLGTFTTSGTGTLQTQSVSATPIPSGRTFTFDVLYNSASAQTVMGGNYNNLNLTGGNRTLSSSTGTIAVAGTYTQGAGTMTTAGSTLSLGSTTTLPSNTYANLIIAGGTITAPSTLSLSGALTIGSGATFVAPSNALNITGNYSNSGTFTHNNGLVNLNGTNQTVSGSSTFYRFTKSVSTAYSLTFASGQTQTFLNALTLTGTNGNLLTVNASTISSQAILTPTSGLSTISYTALKDLNNNSGTTVLLTACTDNGNNSGFSFATVPGTPTSITATADNAQALITYTAPVSNGGATIIDYTITAIPSSGSNIVRTGITANPYTFTGLANGTSYTFTISSRNSVGTGATITSNQIIPTSTTTWNGTSWSATAPDGSQSGVIAANLNSNNLNGVFTVCAGLTINSGVTFTLNSNVTVNGAFINNGTITGTGTLILAGGTSQTISGTGTVSCITINNSNGVNVLSGNNNLGITGVLTLQSGQLTTNGNVTFKSTSIANTGVLAPYGASGNTGTINGTVTVERYIPAGYRAYRDMAAQLSGVGTIYNNWQEGGSFTSGKGIFITGTGATDANTANYASGQPVPNANGLDFSISGNNSAFTYSYPTFTPLANTKVTLDPFVGYRVLIRGDRSFNLATTPIINYYGYGLRMYNATVLRSIGGKLITGTVTYNTTNASGTTYDGAAITSTAAALNTTPGTFSMVANPYAAPVMWGTGTVTNSSTTTVYGASSNINGSYWFLDPTLGATGFYRAYNAVTGSSVFTLGTGGNSSGTTGYQYIQPGQAFLVQTGVAGNPTVVFNETAKAVTSTKLAVFGVTAPLSKIYISLLKKDSTANYNMVDGAAIAFHESFTNDAYGSQDALKFSNANDNLYITDKGKNLSIDGRLPATAADKLPIAISKVSGTNYQLVVDATNYTSNGYAPYLVDSYRGTTTTLTNGTNTITFTADANVAATYSNRFSIAFKPTTLAVSSIAASATLNNKIATISWNTVGEKGVSRFEVEKSTDAKTFTKLSQTIAKNTATAYYSIMENGVTATTYYRIKAISEVGTVSYSNLVQLTVNSKQFTVYPNPLVGKVLTLSFGNISAGKYTVTINTVLGQKVQEAAISHAGGNGSHAITVNSFVAAGPYSVTVRDANGQAVYQSNLLVQP